LNLETRHSLELSVVIRDENQAQYLRMRGDPEAISADGFSFRLQPGSDFTILSRRILRESQDWQEGYEIVQERERKLSLLAPGRTVKQFAVCDHRECRLSSFKFFEASKNLDGAFLANVYADVGVEEKPRHGYSPRLFCGGSSLRPSAKKSSGIPASK
jgi:hypothetical protein